MRLNVLFLKKKFTKHLRNLRHGTLEKIYAIQENHQEFEKKCDPVKATKRFSRLCKKFSPR